MMPVLGTGTGLEIICSEFSLFFQGLENQALGDGDAHNSAGWRT